MKSIKSFLIICFALIPNLSFAQGLIAYSHLTDGFWQIWVMQSDGSGQRQITTSPKDKRNPSWIGKEKRICFRTNNGTIYLVNKDGESEEQILGKFGYINNPSYNEKTGKLVFARFEPQVMDLSDIWISDLQGSSTKMLTRDRKLKYQPALSPDGVKMAYVLSDNDTKYHNIHLRDIDTGKDIALTGAKGLNTLPNFSPDGKQLLFSSNRDGNYEIYSLVINSRREKRLTKNKSLDSNATFSPSGEMIVFVSNRSGNQQIWVMDKNGKNPKQLTGGDESIDPAWGME
ncbi:MAG: PD40 domain-containing protein [Candidatus Omnitrophica bacterium]|nr:PD40 domain-containing protein [Candidatus Omnitrophota bacterium]